MGSKKLKYFKKTFSLSLTSLIGANLTTLLRKSMSPVLSESQSTALENKLMLSSSSRWGFSFPLALPFTANSLLAIRIRRESLLPLQAAYSSSHHQASQRKLVFYPIYGLFQIEQARLSIPIHRR